MNHLTTTNQTSAEGALMSSREIAELTGKDHFNVMRDIRTMLEDLGIGALSFEGSYMSAQNKPLPLFNLPKDLTITLVSGYNVVMRHRIVTRWQELETQVATPALPNFNNPAEAARAWACHHPTFLPTRSKS